MVAAAGAVPAMIRIEVSGIESVRTAREPLKHGRITV
jgi:hypothetical protein